MRFYLSRGFVSAFVAGATVVLAALPADADSQQVADGTPRQDMLLAAAPKPVPAIAPLVTRTRFVVGLDRKVEYQVFSLANPNRVVVELPDVKLQLPAQSENATVGLVRSFRGGLAAPGKNRIVIDVTQPVVVESAKLEKDAAGNYRLALDILPMDAALKAGARKGMTPAPLGPDQRSSARKPAAPP